MPESDAVAKLAPLVRDRLCTLFVEGHAQPTESGSPGHEIALRRALSVAEELLRLGFPGRRMHLAAVEEPPVTSRQRPAVPLRSPLIDQPTAGEIDRNERSVEILIYQTD